MARIYALTLAPRVAALAGSVPAMTNTPAVFDAVAASYNLSRRRLIPPFEAFYRTAVEALRLANPAPSRVLDLGAGTGMLSAFVRAEFPDVQLTLLDGAPKMLAQANDALGTGDVKYLERDLAEPLPDGPWDAIVSALAIHHLDDEAKLDLYRRIRAALGPGGMFVNAEHVAAPSPVLEAEYDRWHEGRARAAGSDDAEWGHAVGMMAHDQRAPVHRQLSWLHEAGFRHVDCLFKEYSFAVLVAIP